MSEDVQSTLDELERKLSDLEEELRSVPLPAGRNGGGADGGSESVATPAAPVRRAVPMSVATAERAAAPAPEPAAAAPARAADDLPAALEDATRFRERLERSARELAAEYERVLERLRVATDAALAARAPAPAPPVPAAPATAPPGPAVGWPSGQAVAPPRPAAVAAPAPAPWRSHPATSRTGLDAAVLDGAVSVDAGPFVELTALSAFEQALAAIPDVRDVHLRGFDGSRAQLDVRLGRPTALGAELRRTAAAGFTVTRAEAGGLSIAIEPPV